MRMAKSLECHKQTLDFMQLAERVIWGSEDGFGRIRDTGWVE